MNHIYDIIIIGGGPAGLTAALYACRARMKTVLIERMLCGGQVLIADTIENYPGFPEGIKGPDLAEWMLKQVEHFGLEVKSIDTIKIKSKGGATMTKISDGLTKSLRRKSVIRLMTSHLNGDAIDGIVLHQTADYVVFALEMDFEFNGIAFLSKKFVRGIRDSKYEKCYNKIVRFNKSIDKVRIPDWVKDCLCLEDVLKQLKRKSIWPGVEMVFSKKNTKNNSAFYIGPIQDVNSNEFQIYSYDADGSWEKCYKLHIDEIFKIGFYDRYSTHFNKFVQTFCMPKDPRTRRT